MGKKLKFDKKWLTKALSNLENVLQNNLRTGQSQGVHFSPIQDGGKKAPPSSFSLQLRQI